MAGTRIESTFGGGFRGGLVKVTDPSLTVIDFLASEKYQVKPSGITLDATGVAAAGDGTKIVKGGTVLAKLTGGAQVGKYVPYAAAGANGAATAVGLAFTDYNLQWGDIVASLLVQASAYEARVFGMDAAAKTALIALGFKFF
jgi:hypothetical protein